jgi:hypothetical protein
LIIDLQKGEANMLNQDVSNSWYLKSVSSETFVELLEKPMETLTAKNRLFAADSHPRKDF